ncbi:hypothetical protein SCHPADRAFT_925104 [Schizopora paradoxa]|uniref:Uncharacterized protein n=1 Tax=Schizopora paradoxa TaxID=27342 RepID=A0A0H2SN19_9AGAM|nr:hypothetical protein SCHPADRAFT_925104 [Schizopora paradoxa]
MRMPARQATGIVRLPSIKRATALIFAFDHHHNESSFSHLLYSLYLYNPIYLQKLSSLTINEFCTPFADPSRSSLAQHLTSLIARDPIDLVKHLLIRKPKIKRGTSQYPTALRTAKGMRHLVCLCRTTLERLVGMAGLRYRARKLNRSRTASLDRSSPASSEVDNESSARSPSPRRLG